VNAEVVMLDDMSAHADYREILTWLEGFQKPPRKIFITHGEEKASLSLKAKIEEKFGWTCVVPNYMQTEEL
jgi:metallo-beta-lactamase family protein